MGFKSPKWFGYEPKEVLEAMLNIKKEYVVGDDNKKRAVLIDMKTFERIEEILENFGLSKYMEEIEEEETLGLEDAKNYYENLRKE